MLQDFHSAFANLLTRAQQAKAVREDIDLKDLLILMSNFLAIEQREGALDIERFACCLLSAMDFVIGIPFEMIGGKAVFIHLELCHR